MRICNGLIAGIAEQRENFACDKRLLVVLKSLLSDNSDNLFSTSETSTLCYPPPFAPSLLDRLSELVRLSGARAYTQSSHLTP